METRFLLKIYKTKKEKIKSNNMGSASKASVKNVKKNKSIYKIIFLI
tara:strand:+ start:171 stop:311 length:141 start_codon:yes stop_codon:yes gene_type:complete